MWLSDGEIAVAVVPKCGSSSIRDMVKTIYREIEPGDAIKVPRRLCWIRDPFERLVSAFSYFHYVPYLPASIAGRWESFVDYTFKEDDPHWTPQSELLSFDNVLVPNEVYWLKDLQKTWPFPGLLPWIRGVRHVEVDGSYRRDEIDEKYREDYALCLSVDT